MKILYLSADFGVPILGGKGASVHVRELSDALMQLGHEVVILTPNLGAGNQTRAEVRLVPAPRFARPIAALLRGVGAPWGKGERLERELRELSYNAVLRSAAWRFAAEWRPQVVYERYALFGVAGGIVAARLRVPHLLEVNAPLRLERHRGPGLACDGLAAWCERQIFCRASRVLCVSPALAEYVRGRGVPPERLLIQPNAVDPAKFSPSIPDQILRTQLGFTPEQVVVGFVGSLKPWHGVEQLVAAFARACARAPQLRLLIVGDGPTRRSVEQAIARHAVGPRCVLVGARAHAEVPHYLAAMDIAVAPYRGVADFYFSPLKLFEYLAAGKPVVAPLLGQIADIVQDQKNGLLYPPEQIEELAGRLTLLAERPDLRTALGKQAAQEVQQRHTWQAVSARIIALSEQVLREASSAS